MKYKKVERLIGAERFVKMMKEKWGRNISLKHIEKLQAGECLCMIRNTEKKTETFYFLKKIWIRRFTLNYSCKKGRYPGKELLISNMDLGRRPIIGRNIIPKKTRKNVL